MRGTLKQRVLMANYGANITGMLFGKLTVIKESYKDKNYNYYWLCVCSCGNQAVVRKSSLISGHTTSCGCNVTYNRKHMQSHSSEYKAWNQMIQRCTNPKNKHYKDYGGRGIMVCDRWLYNALNFLEDMGDKPTPNHSLDRINNDGNYDPSNCKWSTPKEQANNTRRYINDA